MLNKRNNSENLLLIISLRGNTCSLSSLNIIFAMCCHVWTFMLRYISSIPTLLRGFISSGFWILSNDLSVFIVITRFLFFIMLVIYVNLFALIEPSLHSWDKFTWSWCLNFLMYCWTRCSSILFKIFTSMFINDIDLEFSFSVVPVLFWYQGDAGLTDELGDSQSSLIFLLVWKLLTLPKIFGRIHSGHGLYLLGAFLITDSVSSLVIDWFIFSISSRFILGILFISRHLCSFSKFSTCGQTVVCSSNYLDPLFFCVLAPNSSSSISDCVALGLLFFLWWVWLKVYQYFFFSKHQLLLSVIFLLWSLLLVSLY